MRILIAHAYYRIRGGEDRYVDEQAALVSEIHDVRLFTRSNADLSSPVEATTSVLGLNRRSRALGAELDSFRPDIVHVHNVFPALGPVVHNETAERGIPLVMTVHNYRLRCPNGLTFTEGKPCQRCVTGSNANAVLHHCFLSSSQAAVYALGLSVHRRLAKTETKVDLYLTPSDFVTARLHQWGIEPSRVRTVRSFTRAFPNASTEPGAYGLYLGRLSAEKGIDVLLRALASTGDPPFKVVGEGPGRDELLALARTLGLQRTEFVGRLETKDVDEVIRGARYVTMPSLWDETGGLAAMEGMAAGRPILVSDRGGLPELTSSGGGFSVTAGDVVATSAAITRFMSDDGLCAEMGARGLDLAREHLSEDAHLTAIDGVYRELSGGGSEPPEKAPQRG